jgi:CheY-like chemotaxis protein
MMSKILIIEDDALTREFYKCLFKRTDIEAFILDDGDEAIQILSNEEIKLILMDINLNNTFLNTVKMDGIKLSRHIKTSMNGISSIPILLVTAYSILPTQENFINQSMAQGIISKPILDHNEFINKIKMMMLK